MAIFGRKRSSPAPSTNTPSITPADWIGRKLRTQLSIDESLTAFETAESNIANFRGKIEATWVVPPTAASFSSSQGATTQVVPERVVRYEFANGDTVVLALWDGMVTSGDGNLNPGPPREMWLVPSHFDTSGVLPVVGHWKSVDPSLSSIGWVERPQWGAVND